MVCQTRAQKVLAVELLDLLCEQPFKNIDVAQRVDELLFLYTNIRLRHHHTGIRPNFEPVRRLHIDHCGGSTLPAEGVDPC